MAASDTAMTTSPHVEVAGTPVASSAAVWSALVTWTEPLKGPEILPRLEVDRGTDEPAGVLGVRTVGELDDRPDRGWRGTSELLVNCQVCVLLRVGRRDHRELLWRDSADVEYLRLRFYVGPPGRSALEMMYDVIVNGALKTRLPPGPISWAKAQPGGALACSCAASPRVCASPSS